MVINSSDDEIGLQVSNQIKQSSKRSKKQNIRQSAPLRSTPGKGKAAAAAGTVSDKAWLQQCEELYESLPKNSAWAKHKLKVRRETLSAAVVPAVLLLSRGCCNGWTMHLLVLYGALHRHQSNVLVIWVCILTQAAQFPTPCSILQAAGLSDEASSIITGSRFQPMPTCIHNASHAFHNFLTASSA